MKHHLRRRRGQSSTEFLAVTLLVVVCLLTGTSGGVLGEVLDAIGVRFTAFSLGVSRP